MPSTLAALPVMTALVAKLQADATLVAMLATAPASVGGGPGIYNGVAQGALRPYVVIDGATEVPSNTLGPVTAAKWGGDCTVQIKAVSNQSGDSEGLAILSRAKTVLDGKPLTVAGFATVIVAWDSLQPSFSELVPGSPGSSVRHVPAIVRVQVSES